MTTETTEHGHAYRERRDQAASQALAAIADALKLIADGAYGPAQVPLRDALDRLKRADGEDECYRLANAR